ncbi:Hypothetical predicted protein [Pelobates cultripes]|uniref:Uncharacterized protein n=1 Tax=Pelobates cultripes TaxID=61616 RepID=A0AAD1SC61_PELCU|nr:Hypothetical predicted protein [Pelobates cultripes]
MTAPSSNRRGKNQSKGCREALTGGGIAPLPLLDPPLTRECLPSPTGASEPKSTRPQSYEILHVVLAPAFLYPATAIFLLRSLKQVDAGGSIFLGGVNNIELVYCLNQDLTLSKGTTLPLTQIEGRLKYYSCGRYGCWGVNAFGDLFYRLNVSPNDCSGKGWRQVSGNMVMVEAEKEFLFRAQKEHTGLWCMYAVHLNMFHMIMDFYGFLTQVEVSSNVTPTSLHEHQLTDQLSVTVTESFTVF